MEYLIKFKYADRYSNWEWRDQQCALYANSAVDARLKCIDFYGLGKDCDYQIVSVEEINE
jgi:hypothetical protein